MSFAPLRVHFVSWDKDSDVSGQAGKEWEDQVKGAMRLRREGMRKPQAFGVRDPYVDGDLSIHLAQPIQGAFPWAHVHWLWVPEGGWKDVYEETVHALDIIWVETEKDKDALVDNTLGRFVERIRVRTMEAVKVAMEECVELVRNRRPAHGVRHLPPVLERADCPPVTIVTPTFQRKKLMEIAYHNLLATDYPLNRIEWIVVEDNDKSPHVMRESLAGFQQKVPDVQIRYIPLEGRRSVGEKRNVGVMAASNEWIMFMDDDDHYPITSFRRRMAWLLKGSMSSIEKKHRIVACTTIALYDLKRGVSAVNVPPLDLPFSQRISEATLAFHRSVWEERAFPEVSIAEGESWIKDRELEVLEIPPQQIIVAFTHGGNQSSRRLPPSNQNPACFWGFPKEYLVFIHGLVGVDVTSE